MTSQSSIETLRTDFLTMKPIGDALINLGTLVLFWIASSLICAPHPDAFRWEVPNEVRVIFLSVTALIALSNITGLPKQQEQRWKQFGSAFFAPFTISNPQQCAGVMEATGIVFTLLEYPIMRGFGYAQLMVLYGRGAMVNAQYGDWVKALVAAGVSVTAGVLLKDEFYTVL